MHSSTQIIAQRALPATRTKARWQPYCSIPSSSTNSLPAPRSPNMITPASSLASPLPSQASIPTSSSSRSSTSSMSAAQPPKDVSQRDPSKHKFAAGLIDQAVNILSEIWRPQDIPRAFQTPPKGTTPFTSASSINPCTSTHSATSKTPFSSISQSFEPSLPPSSTTDPNQQLLPMKTFVHEVLRRSRTSASILQAALCYLEAVRSKVPEILRKEQLGIRTHFLPDSAILPATPAELEREAELSAAELGKDCDDLVMTIRVTDLDSQDMDQLADSDTGDGASMSSLLAEPSVPSEVSTPALPSPLLCPRRTFLASLILASKFFQDKCYSNRAWAKLSGLPPREIGRCERALGQALDWRLWVGKSPVQPQSTAPASSRSIARSQSEASIFTPPAANQPFLVEDSTTKADGACPVKQAQPPQPRSSLRRWSTAPSHVFSAGPQDSPVASSSKKVVQHEAEAVTSASVHCLSPRPPTPPLTYSPSSTESSMGDRTIQMSSFEDNVFTTLDGVQTWLDNTNSRPAAKAVSPFSVDVSSNYVDGELVLGLVGLAARAQGISIVEPDGGTYGQRYLWQDESHYRQVEPAGVH